MSDVPKPDNWDLPIDVNNGLTAHLVPLHYAIEALGFKLP